MCSFYKNVYSKQHTRCKWNKTSDSLGDNQLRNDAIHSEGHKLPQRSAAQLYWTILHSTRHNASYLEYTLIIIQKITTNLFYNRITEHGFKFPPVYIKRMCLSTQRTHDLDVALRCSQFGHVPCRKHYCLLLSVKHESDRELLH